MELLKYLYLSTETTSYNMAMKSVEKNKWTEASNEKLNNMEGHAVWEDQHNKP